MLSSLSGLYALSWARYSSSFAYTSSACSIVLTPKTQQLLKVGTRSVPALAVASLLSPDPALSQQM